ncbi:MAG: hypothetical protein ACHQQ3_01970 [Gemmatimonadales bacterium]
MRKRLIPLALASLGLGASLASMAAPLGAQGISDGSLILGPQYVSYKFGTGAAAKTVTELGVPFAVVLPMGEKFALDISSAFANVNVSTQAGGTSSSINGLTDTQIRGNLTLGDNVGVLTIGVNLPTGMYKVPTGKQEAAGQIGNDFLVYPVSSMGNGLGATGGLAFAQPIGDWNLGLGASFRHSTAFDAYQVGSTALRFQPGDEVRLRVGLDRPILDGRFSMGVTYSKFGNDAANDTTFGTGDRALGQASLYLPTGGGDFQISAWNLYRAEGKLVGGGISPWENVANVNMAVGFNAGGVYIQPNVEARFWQVDSYHAGTLGNVGLRFRFNMGALSVNPTAGYVMGKLYTQNNGPTTDITGFKGSLLIRIH